MAQVMLNLCKLENNAVAIGDIGEADTKKEMVGKIFIRKLENGEFVITNQLDGLPQKQKASKFGQETCSDKSTDNQTEIELQSSKEGESISNVSSSVSTRDHSIHNVSCIDVGDITNVTSELLSDLNQPSSAAVIEVQETSYDVS